MRGVSSPASVSFCNKCFIHRPCKKMAQDVTIYQAVCGYLFQCIGMMDKFCKTKAYRLFLCEKRDKENPLDSSSWIRRFEGLKVPIQIPGGYLYVFS